MSGVPESSEGVSLSSSDYFRVIEERRRAAEGVLWQLPSISLAAQAFLLSAGLSADAEPSSQIAVGSLGIAAALGTGLVMLYQALRATIFGDWVSKMVDLPLLPEEIAATGLKYDQKKIRRFERVFKVFGAACIGALIAFLVADGYVLCQGAQGVGWW